jgi:hypothetical protein
MISLGRVRWGRFFGGRGLFGLCRRDGVGGRDEGIWGMTVKGR